MELKEKIVGAVSIVIIVVTLLALTPTVVDQVQDMNTSGWTFTGAEGAIALLGLVPFIWVAMILIAAAVGMFSLAKLDLLKGADLPKSKWLGRVVGRIYA
ncbi:hypothetical protein ES702_02561 [subsurface metagenome]